MLMLGDLMMGKGAHMTLQWRGTSGTSVVGDTTVIPHAGPPSHLPATPSAKNASRITLRPPFQGIRQVWVVKDKKGNLHNISNISNIPNISHLSIQWKGLFTPV